MTKRTIYLLLLICLFTLTSTAVQAQHDGVRVTNLSDRLTLVRVETNAKYLLLPVEEDARDARITVITDNQSVQTLNVRLSVERTDYYVPLQISDYENELILSVSGVKTAASCWKEIRLSDTYDTRNRETYRPLYHFTPQYGWMNDPNGMVYKNGEYHLFYQYNPYGSVWGNMHWGHAISRDLVSWQHAPVAIAPDGLGSIFSGSCVVDHNNTAGFGAGAIVAFYTSSGMQQMQSMAYSTDNGRTFIKYDRNPIITADIRDFRDPKVFWHQPTGRWNMILACGQEMRIYSSPDLKSWAYESSFGKDQGAHGGVWECPDLFEVPVEGTKNSKWVLVCNINPGGPFGGSATQYFVGTFDGKQFINDSPSVTKWMDYGKDHYATVTWSDAPNNRRVGLAWMSNWQYANEVPTLQFRSANSVPRDYTLFTNGGDTWLKSAPVPELDALRRESSKPQTITVSATRTVAPLPIPATGTCEITLTLRERTGVLTFSLTNDKGEAVLCKIDRSAGTFSMDRTRSGKVDFHKEFAATTVAPLENGTLTLRLLIDKSSIEVFGNGGRFAMTNLVFPSEPYNALTFQAEKGTFRVRDIVISKLEL